MIDGVPILRWLAEDGSWILVVLVALCLLLTSLNLTGWDD
jgi:hypothetical protein